MSGKTLIIEGIKKNELKDQGVNYDPIDDVYSIECDKEYGNVHFVIYLMNIFDEEEKIS